MLESGFDAVESAAVVNRISVNVARRCYILVMSEHKKKEFVRYDRAGHLDPRTRHGFVR